jgi:hypothetical protein
MSTVSFKSTLNSGESHKRPCIETCTTTNLGLFTVTLDHSLIEKLTRAIANGKETFV